MCDHELQLIGERLTILIYYTEVYIRGESSVAALADYLLYLFELTNESLAGGFPLWLVAQFLGIS